MNVLPFVFPFRRVFRWEVLVYGLVLPLTLLSLRSFSPVLGTINELIRADAERHGCMTVDAYGKFLMEDAPCR